MSRMFLIVFWAFLSSCSIKKDDSTLSYIQFLQNQLVVAERALLRDQEEVERLRVKLYDAELTLIEARVSQFERAWRSHNQLDTSFFLKDREMLHRIIQAELFSARASDLLDRILQLITQVSDANHP